MLTWYLELLHAPLIPTGAAVGDATTILAADGGGCAHPLPAFFAFGIRAYWVERPLPDCTTRIRHAVPFVALFDAFPALAVLTVL